MCFVPVSYRRYENRSCCAFGRWQTAEFIEGLHLCHWIGRFRVAAENVWKGKVFLIWLIFFSGKTSYLNMFDIKFDTKFEFNSLYIFINWFPIFYFQSDETHPHLDLCASNNALNIRTCWDSASALCRLVTYISLDGDNMQPVDPASRHASFCSDQAEPLVGKWPFCRDTDF